MCNAQAIKTLRVNGFEVGLCNAHKSTSLKYVQNLIWGNMPIYEYPDTKSFIDIINSVVCDHFKVPIEELKTINRNGHIPKSKHWIFFLIDYYQIGLTHELIGGLYESAHPNVTISIRKIRDNITKKKPGYKAIFKYFTEIIDQKIKLNK